MHPGGTATALKINPCRLKCNGFS